MFYVLYFNFHHKRDIENATVLENDLLFSRIEIGFFLSFINYFSEHLFSSIKLTGKKYNYHVSALKIIFCRYMHIYGPIW